MSVITGTAAGGRSISRGEIRPIKIGRKTLILDNELHRFLAAQIAHEESETQLAVPAIPLRDSTCGKSAINTISHVTNLERIRARIRAQRAHDAEKSEARDEQ